MAKLALGVFFGGKSTEHEISVITALQAINNLDKDKYEIIPVYVSKQSDFYTGSKLLDIKSFKDLDSLILSLTPINLGRNRGAFGFFNKGLMPKFTKIDVAFPIFHGAFGEDGAIQGVFEVNNVPYVGLGVASSAVGMDKTISKPLFKSLGLNVLDSISFTRNDWLKDSDKIVENILNNFKMPIFVKPATLGSSIGVNKVSDRDGLSFAIEVAFVYCEKVLIEEALENVVEVNCSVLGYKEFKASVCEMPISTGELLSFADKYQKGSKGSKSQGMASLARKIPAPIDEKTTKQIQDISIKIFGAMDGCGVARIDYFVDEKNQKIIVNEINTIPGSLSYYLWDKSGIKFPDLLDKLIEMAKERHSDRGKTQYTFSTNVLQNFDSKGLKS